MRQFYACAGLNIIFLASPVGLQIHNMLKHLFFFHPLYLQGVPVYSAVLSTLVFSRVSVFLLMHSLDSRLSNRTFITETGQQVLTKFGIGIYIRSCQAN
jgi:hypothetical protein